METEVGQKPRRIVLEIAVPGNVPSFKNKKRAFVADDGTPGLSTLRKVKKRMAAIIQGIELALCIEYRTRGGATGTGCTLQSWIASSLPLDDSLDWIPESDGYRVEYVEPGKEGVVIILEEILPSETKVAINKPE